MALVLPSGSVTADYTGGTGSARLTFEHEVGGNATVTGVILEANSLRLNGGIIQDDEGTDAVLDDNGVAVSGRTTRSTPTAPGSTTCRSTPRATSRGRTATRSPWIDWNGNVTVTGEPTVDLEIDSEEDEAEYKERERHEPARVRARDRRRSGVKARS